MVNPIYDEMQGVAKNLLNEFAQGGVEYKRIIPGTGSADDPGPATVEYFAFDAVVRGVKFIYVQSGLAVAGQLQATLAVRDDVTPDISGFIRLNGKEEYKITQVLPIPPQGTPIVHTVIFGNADNKAIRIQHA